MSVEIVGHSNILSRLIMHFMLILIILVLTPMQHALIDS